MNASAAAMTMQSPAAGFAELDRLYRSTLGICDDLEAVADSLPEPDRRRCRQLAVALKPAIEAANALEEAVLFPAILHRLPKESAAIERLRREHLHDRAAADEVARVLLMLSKGGGARSWDATGYMLRAYFVSVRRHVACEQSLIASLRTIAARP